MTKPMKRSTSPDVPAAARGPRSEGDRIETPTIRYANVFVSDLGRAVEFFGNRLGLELQHRTDEHGYASFAAGPIRLGLARVDPDGEHASMLGRHTGIGFAVADLVAAHRELADKGVEFTTAPQRYPWGGFMASFRDPDGNLYYLDEVEPA